jgi:hypothetical protein
MRVKPSNHPPFLTHSYPCILNSDHTYSTVSWSSWQIASSSYRSYPSALSSYISYPSALLLSFPLVAHSKKLIRIPRPSKSSNRGEVSCGHKSRAGPKVVGYLQDSYHQRNIAQVTDDAACHASLCVRLANRYTSCLRPHTLVA